MFQSNQNWAPTPSTSHYFHPYHHLFSSTNLLQYYPITSGGQHCDPRRRSAFPPDNDERPPQIQHSSLNETEDTNDAEIGHQSSSVAPTHQSVVQLTNLDDENHENSNPNSRPSKNQLTPNKTHITEMSRMDNSNRRVNRSTARKLFKYDMMDDATSSEDQSASSANEIGMFPGTKVKRRVAATQRERFRSRKINDGFEALRRHLPEVYQGRKLSKHETLMLAQAYISQLANILDNPSSSPSPHQQKYTPNIGHQSSFSASPLSTAQYSSC